MKAKIQRSLPCNKNSSIWNEKTLQGTIKLSFLTMFISVESFSLNWNQFAGLHYDGILQVWMSVVCSNSNEYSYGIKQLKEKPQLSAHSKWGFKNSQSALWLSLSLAMQDRFLPEPVLVTASHTPAHHTPF